MGEVDMKRELAYYVADLLEIYASHRDGEMEKCRSCFVADLVSRIETDESLRPSQRLRFELVRSTPEEGT
jgi:hypothetical protein